MNIPSIKPRPSLLRRLTSSRRVLPKVICIGAQRCGTTTLAKFLRSHPDCVPAMRKECHYFDTNMCEANTLNKYRAYFPTVSEMSECSENAFTFDVTPAYLLFEKVAENLAKLIPEAKLLILMRDPTRRAISQCHHARRRTEEKFQKSLEDQIDAELKLEANDPNHPITYDNFLSRGHYLDQIKYYEARFPREQLMYVCSEHYYAEPQIWIDRIADFFEIPRWAIDPANRSKINPYEKPTPELLRKLDDYFAPRNEALFEHLGQHFPWGNNTSETG